MQKFNYVFVFQVFSIFFLVFWELRQGVSKRCFQVIISRAFLRFLHMFRLGFWEAKILAGIASGIRLQISSDIPSSIRSKNEFPLKIFSDPSRNISKDCFSILNKNFFRSSYSVFFFHKFLYKFLLKFSIAHVEIVSGIIAENRKGLFFKLRLLFFQNIYWVSFRGSIIFLNILQRILFRSSSTKLKKILRNSGGFSENFCRFLTRILEEILKNFLAPKALKQFLDLFLEKLPGRTRGEILMGTP